MNASVMTKVKSKAAKEQSWSTDVDFTWEHQNKQLEMQPYLSQYNMQNSQYSRVKVKKERSNWYCQACDVMLISREHARVHYYGGRHQKVLNLPRLRIVELGVKCEGQETGFDPRKSFKSPSVIKSELKFEIPSFADRGNILETVKGKLLKGKQKKTFYPSDLTTYITPTGKYYCQLCNRMGQKQAQFQQHLDSRKHRLKVANAIKKADKQIGPHFSITSTNSPPKDSSIDVGCDANLTFIKQEVTSVEDSPRV